MNRGSQTSILMETTEVASCSEIFNSLVKKYGDRYSIDIMRCFVHFQDSDLGFLGFKVLATFIENFFDQNPEEIDRCAEFLLAHIERSLENIRRGMYSFHYDDE